MNENNRIHEDSAGNDPSARAEKIRTIRAAINAEGDQPHTRDSVPMKSRQTAKKKPPSSAKKKRKKKKKKTFGQSVRDLFPKKGDSILEMIRKIVFMAAVIAIIVCGYMVGEYYLDLWRSRLQYNEIADIYDTYEPGENSANGSGSSEFSPYDKYYTMLTAAKKLLDINEDVVGYMRIPTKDGDPIIELPVVQAEDNNKYLHLNFNGDDSRSGALFLDWRNNFDRVKDHYLVEKNSDNLVVYGHNIRPMRNTTKITPLSSSIPTMRHTAIRYSQYLSLTLLMNRKQSTIAGIIWFSTAKRNITISSTKPSAELYAQMMWT